MQDAGKVFIELNSCGRYLNGLPTEKQLFKVQFRHRVQHHIRKAIVQPENRCRADRWLIQPEIQCHAPWMQMNIMEKFQPKCQLGGRKRKRQIHAFHAEKS